jgi:hypothetical protein
MATKISNVMFEIQATKNIVLFPNAPSLKNVTSLSNGKEKNSIKKSLTKKTN